MFYGGYGRLSPGRRRIDTCGWDVNHSFMNPSHRCLFRGVNGGQSSIGPILSQSRGQIEHRRQRVSPCQGIPIHFLPRLRTSRDAAGISTTYSQLVVRKCSEK